MVYKTSTSLCDYHWLREQARAQHARSSQNIYSYSRQQESQQGVKTLIQTLLYFCTTFSTFSHLFVLFHCFFIKIFEIFLIFSFFNFYFWWKNGVARVHDMWNMQGQNRIEDSPSPRLERNIVLNVWWVKAILTKF